MLTHGCHWFEDSGHGGDTTEGPNGEGVTCLIFGSLPLSHLNRPTLLFPPDSKKIWQVRTWSGHGISVRPGAPGPSQAHP